MADHEVICRQLLSAHKVSCKREKERRKKAVLLVSSELVRFLQWKHLNTPLPLMSSTSGSQISLLCSFLTLGRFAFCKIQDFFFFCCNFQITCLKMRPYMEWGFAQFCASVTTLVSVELQNRDLAPLSPRFGVKLK